ncbi:MAG: ATP-grasp domain-containing protein [Candidatus Eutrophobiaceae bacterium]
MKRSRHIAIFTEEPGWHGAALAKSFGKKGWSLHFVSLSQCRMELGADSCRIALPGIEGLPAGAFVRSIQSGSLEQVVFRMNILHVLEQQGISVCNPPRAIERAVDKPLTSVLLATQGVPVPQTWVCESLDEAREVLRKHTNQGGRLVQKPLFGSQGTGIHLLQAGDDLVHDGKFAGVYLLQAFVERDEWVDYRVMVASGQAIAAMRRRGRMWLTNRAQGAACEALSLENDFGQRLGKCAARAAQLLGMDYAGVDLIEDREGRLMVLELNSLPAWQGLQAVCAFSISDRLVECLLERLEEGERL